MFKKLTYLILLVFLTGGFYAFLTGDKEEQSFLKKECAFCNSVIVDKQAFYEDELVLALYTHKPIFAGHCLIIPKRHVERFEMLSDAESIRINQVIKKVHQAAQQVFGTSAYLLLQKNGQEVGQTVPHVHFHYIPRKSGEDSSLAFILKMYLINMRKPISEAEMDEAVYKMKEAITDLDK